MTTGQPRAPLFRERLTGRFAPEAAVASLPFLLGGALAALQGAAWLALPLAAFGVFGAAFFRNPARTLPDDPDAVLAPADGKVMEVGVCELADGRKALRIGIFLSVFDVHVNRAPVAGRVRGVVRSGSAYFAAFRPEAAARNVQLALELETASGARVGVVQAVHVGEHDQRVGGDEVHHQRRQAVVVAELDLLGRHGVVLVDDRHRAKFQQRTKRVPHVEVPLAILQVFGRQ